MMDGHPRKTLDVLASRNITGSDAATALDTFCLRAGAYLAAKLEDIQPQDRNDFLVQTFGSDAVRVALALMAGPKGEGSPDGH